MRRLKDWRGDLVKTSEEGENEELTFWNQKELCDLILARFLIANTRTKVSSSGRPSCAGDQRSSTASRVSGPA